MKVVVVVVLREKKFPRNALKEVFSKDKLMVDVGSTDNPVLTVYEIVEEKTNVENITKTRHDVLAIFKNWEYFRIME